MITELLDPLTTRHFAMSSHDVLSRLGRDVLLERITNAVITDTKEYSSWGVYYGICHAFTLLEPHNHKYWKELRSHFLYKMHGIDGIMYTGKRTKDSKYVTK
jgi:hypothetical protein